MTTTDTNLQNLIINDLSQSDYESITPEANELYLTDEVIESSDIITALGYTPYNSSNPSGYITSSALSGYQTTTNLVTSVSSSSTNSQYPSAKLFYDTCGDIESLINALQED